MKARNRLWGIVLLVVAVLVFLTATGLLSIPALTGISTAKLVWTIILGVILIGSIISFSYEGIIISAGILLKMYESYLGISISVPMLIIVMILLIVALNFLIPEKARNRNKCDNAVFSEEENANYIYIKTKFNGTTKYIESKNLEEVEVEAAYGGCEIYMTRADAPSGKITMNLSIKGAGTDIYIPQNWRVVNNARFTLSGYDEDPIVLGEGEKPPVTLYLNGKVKQSGFSISRNVYNGY